MVDRASSQWSPAPIQVLSAQTRPSKGSGHPFAASGASSSPSIGVWGSVIDQESLSPHLFQQSR
jgi:hypothetical protein